MKMIPNRIESKSNHQRLRDGRQTSRRRRSAVWRLSFCLAAALCLGLALQSSGLALLIVDPQDPVFGPAFHEPFDPSNAPQGATSFTITRAGVEFTFSTTNPNGLFFCSGNNCQLRAPRVGGIHINISPGVSAIGFQHRWVECPGRAVFHGSLGSETFTFPLNTRSGFIGASNIGDIFLVTLESQCGPAESWDDMLFVPAPPPPPSPTPTPTVRYADLVATQTGSGLASNNQHGAFDVDVANLGPDAATDLRVLDFLPNGMTLTGISPAGTVNGNVATINLADLPPNFGSRIATLNFDTLPFPAFGCGHKLLNVAVVTSSSIETNFTNKLTTTRHGVGVSEKSATTVSTTIAMALPTVRIQVAAVSNRPGKPEHIFNATALFRYCQSALRFRAPAACSSLVDHRTILRTRKGARCRTP